MSTVEERIEILKVEYQRLEHYLHTLSPEDWHHPSTCDQWTVADIIAYVALTKPKSPCEPYHIRLIRHQAAARACRSSSL